MTPEGGEESIEVSVVLPVYNEREHLRQEIERILPYQAALATR